VLVHGWTGDENSMWVFARSLRPDYWIIAPRAPFTTEPEGYSWRQEQAGGHSWPSLEELQPGVAALLEMIDAYAAEQQLDAAEFDLMGFSQGAALVLATALLHPGRIGRAAVLAGFIPEGAQSLAEQHPFHGKPFFVAHGTQDPRVPIDFARSAVKVLQKAGAHVTYCEDDVGHKLSLNCLHGLQTFFS
jgi:phospholipase/carboxylesterase